MDKDKCWERFKKTVRERCKSLPCFVVCEDVEVKQAYLDSLGPEVDIMNLRIKEPVPKECNCESGKKHYLNYKLACPVHGKEDTCSACGGSGEETLKENETIPCGWCNGTGKEDNACSACGGKGQIIWDGQECKCKQCNGTGKEV